MQTDFLKRIFDLGLAVLILAFIAIPYLLLVLLVRLTSPGPIHHMSKRIGRNNEIFVMPKLRTMRIDTPQVATHLLQNPDQYLTPVGSFLRRTSLDELPQIFSVLNGDMSFVGPRPALFNQDDLRELRTKCGVHELQPGITGWAQINGRDEIPIPEKVKLDEFYLHNRSLFLDLKIILLTALKVVKSEGVSH